MEFNFLIFIVSFIITSIICRIVYKLIYDRKFYKRLTACFDDEEMMYSCLEMSTNLFLDSGYLLQTDFNYTVDVQHKTIDISVNNRKPSHLLWCLYNYNNRYANKVVLSRR